MRRSHSALSVQDLVDVTTCEEGIPTLHVPLIGTKGLPVRLRRAQGSLPGQYPASRIRNTTPSSLRPPMVQDVHMSTPCIGGHCHIQDVQQAHEVATGLAYALFGLLLPAIPWCLSGLQLFVTSRCLLSRVRAR